MELGVFFSFNVVIFILTVLDFVWINRNNTLRNAVKLSIAWLTLGILFAFVVWYLYGEQGFYEYLGAYFVEKSLSIDNIFVFFLIFSSFSINKKYQHKVLLIGIWSAAFLRLIMIFAVGELIENFHFVVYLFGALIIYAGLTSLREKNDKANYGVMLQYLKKIFNVFDGYHNGRFFIRDNGKFYVTTLFITLLVIEISDIIFAFDSIPALFSITNDKTIIYTSNILAIIGLRSLYSLLAEIINRFVYMKLGIGLVLIFVGVKMVCSDFFAINAKASLCIIAAILLTTVVTSIVIKDRKL